MNMIDFWFIQFKQYLFYEQKIVCTIKYKVSKYRNYQEPYYFSIGFHLLTK